MRKMNEDDDDYDDNRMVMKMICMRMVWRRADGRPHLSLPAAFLSLVGYIACCVSVHLPACIVHIALCVSLCVHLFAIAWCVSLCACLCAFVCVCDCMLCVCVLVRTHCTLHAVCSVYAYTRVYMRAPFKSAMCKKCILRTICSLIWSPSTCLCGVYVFIHCTFESDKNKNNLHTYTQ